MKFSVVTERSTNKRMAQVLMAAVNPTYLAQCIQADELIQQL
jgi:hypothetical protein